MIKLKIKKLKKANRSGLVKVAVQVQGKTGSYNSHRWKNPNAAMDILKGNLKVGKNTDLTFTDKKSGKKLNQKELMESYKRSGTGVTLQEFVGNNFKIGKAEINSAEPPIVTLSNDIKVNDYVYEMPTFNVSEWVGKLPENDLNIDEIMNDSSSGNLEHRFKNNEKYKEIKSISEKLKPMLEAEYTAYMKHHKKFIKTNEITVADLQDEISKLMIEVNRINVMVGILGYATSEDIYGFIQGTETEEEAFNKMLDMIDGYSKDPRYHEYLAYRLLLDKSQFTINEIYGHQYNSVMFIKNTFKDVLSEYKAMTYMGGAEAIKKGFAGGLYPESLSSVKRKDPMSFSQANTGNVNPKLNEDFSYRTNCQSCVVVYEARLRGYDLETKPNIKNKESITGVLSQNTDIAWLDPKTKDVATHTGVYGETDEKYSRLFDFVEPEGRYTLSFLWDGSNTGHIINTYKNKDGELVLYDPQISESYIGEKAIKEYISRTERFKPLELLRVDDKIINPYVISEISIPFSSKEQPYRSVNKYVKKAKELYSPDMKMNKKAINKVKSKANDDIKNQMDSLYQDIKSGLISLQQAINDPKYAKACYLFMLAILDEDEELLKELKL